MRLHLVGVFACHADASQEAPGTMGAQLQLISSEGVVTRIPLVNGRHYGDATAPEWERVEIGDGSSVHALGFIECEGVRLRVDRLTFDLPAGLRLRSARFVDMGTPASFALFDIFAETHVERVCPFSGRASGMSLAEVGAAVRLNDRIQLAKGVDQLLSSLRKVGEDLDEARGSALLFLAVVSAALLEAGSRRALHRFQLETARRFESATDVETLCALAADACEELLGKLDESRGPSEALMEKALAFIERGFGRDLTDADVARQLGMSTSHFRHLFRQTTGQPFHAYLVSLRLEKARAMLMAQDAKVSEVAQIVGFQSPSHFTRLFRSRFGVAPSAVQSAHR